MLKKTYLLIGYSSFLNMKLSSQVLFYLTQQQKLMSVDWGWWRTKHRREYVYFDFRKSKYEQDK